MEILLLFRSEARTHGDVEGACLLCPEAPCVHAHPCTHTPHAPMQVFVFRVTPYDEASQLAMPDPTPGPAREGRAAVTPERPLVGRDTETSFVLNRWVWGG